MSESSEIRPVTKKKGNTYNFLEKILVVFVDTIPWAVLCAFILAAISAVTWPIFAIVAIPMLILRSAGAIYLNGNAYNQQTKEKQGDTPFSDEVNATRRAKILQIGTDILASTAILTSLIAAGTSLITWPIFAVIAVSSLFTNIVAATYHTVCKKNEETMTNTSSSTVMLTKSMEKESGIKADLRQDDKSPTETKSQEAQVNPVVKENVTPSVVAEKTEVVSQPRL